MARCRRNRYSRCRLIESTDDGMIQCGLLDLRGCSVSMKVECPKCNRKLIVKPHLFGKQVKCPGCAQKLKIPAPKTSTPKVAPQTAAQASPPAAAASQPQSLTIACRCTTKLKVPVTARGKKVKCPNCQVTLQIPLPATDSIPAPVATPTPMAVPVAAPMPVAVPAATPESAGFPDLSDVPSVFDSLPSTESSSLQSAGSFPAANPYAKPRGAPVKRRKSSAPSASRAAGTYVVYRYAISIIVMSFHLSSGVKHIPPGGNRFLPGLPYTIISLFFGIWGFPWGPIFTLMSIYRNCAGGHDVTAEVRAAQVRL